MVCGGVWVQTWVQGPRVKRRGGRTGPPVPVVCKGGGHQWGRTHKPRGGGEGMSSGVVGVHRQAELLWRGGGHSPLLLPHEQGGGEGVGGVKTWEGSRLETNRRGLPSWVPLARGAQKSGWWGGKGKGRAEEHKHVALVQV